MEKCLNRFEEARRRFAPSLPSLLKEGGLLKAVEMGKAQTAASIPALFPKICTHPLVNFQMSKEAKGPSLRVGVVLSGGQAAGGHNVIAGLFDALKKMHPQSCLFGFLGGPSGIIENAYKEVDTETLVRFRNMGGFDLIGSGRTKIETPEQLEAASTHCSALCLDGLVIIGGDDSNTNAAILAEYFLNHGCQTFVVGVPKTIDGDLKNAYVNASFGFDTACKIYSEMIGNICRDALSAKKYTHFIKLMGRSASHIALECAFQTHPNITLIGEEIAANKMTLQQITELICDCIQKRAEQGKNYGIVLIPEGVIEFVPEMKKLIHELNGILAQGESDPVAKLSPEARSAYTYLPKEIAEQLLLDRDPHGNVQVSHIATEQLFIHTVKKTLKNRQGFNGKFSPIGHFLGYEGRCGYPSNFDANYCYALGCTAAALISNGLTGYMSVVQKLAESPEAWEPAGIPLTMMMDVEERKGKKKPVIKKALVDLEGAPFKCFSAQREAWGLQDDYRFPGPIQFFGPSEICNETTFTLKLEQKAKAHAF
jgi:pyrophosphate--fructose-6-phosphate 1-phosphotransferase